MKYQCNAKKQVEKAGTGCKKTGLEKALTGYKKGNVAVTAMFKHTRRNYFMQGKNVNLMSYDGFCKCVQIDLQRQLSHLDATVSLQEITKNNGKKNKAIMISEPESNVSPVVYLEQFYKMYLDGKELAQVEHQIVKQYTENAGFEFRMSDFTEWDNISKRIVYRLVNYERNKGLLQGVPHRKFLDLAIIYYALFEDAKFGESGHATIKITNEHMSFWKKSEEDLYSTALQNTFILMPFRYTGIGNVINECFAGSEKDELSENAGSISIMNVLTNEQRLYGAATIIYNHLLSTIAERAGTDLYILPSSVHEVIILPEAKGYDSSELSEMVRIINQTELPADEILSDNVYFYSKEKDEISICMGVAENE